MFSLFRLVVFSVLNGFCESVSVCLFFMHVLLCSCLSSYGPSCLIQMNEWMSEWSDNDGRRRYVWQVLFTTTTAAAAALSVRQHPDWHCRLQALPTAAAIIFRIRIHRNDDDANAHTHTHKQFLRRFSVARPCCRVVILRTGRSYCLRWTIADTLS